jgi:hypothetical protein
LNFQLALSSNRSQREVTWPIISLIKRSAIAFLNFKLIFYRYGKLARDRRFFPARSMRKHFVRKRFDFRLPSDFQQNTGARRSIKKRNSTMHRRFGHGAMEIDATRFGDKSQFKPAFYRAAENCRQVY